MRKEDQLAGLTYLLTLAARLESVIQYQVGRGLNEEPQPLKGL